MNAIAIDFLTILLALIYVVVFVVAVQIVKRLSTASENLIVTIARAGMPGVSRCLLRLLIGYDSRTYEQSQFIIWNQVRFRFSLLWSGLLLLVIGLWALKSIHRIVSVSWPALLITAGYLLIRIVIISTSPVRSVFYPDVKERNSYNGQVIRRWTYLDELFAIPL